VYRIGLSLASQMDLKPVSAFDKGPGERVGAILNESQAATRDDVLTSLDERDEVFADDVRRNIFTFELIPERIEGKDIAAVVRGVDNDILLIALAGATSDADVAARDYIYENLSRRLADNMRDEVDGKGKIKTKEAEAAMGEVVKTIREMIDNNEIEMKDPNEAEEGDS
jgi:flagellar motor switch protein FliG